VAVEREWTSILTGVRARMLAVPSRAGQRLPNLSTHDIGEIDREIRDGLAELGDGN
jgi:phage terminase Nu1 subunit (DNA packaging protein)